MHRKLEGFAKEIGKYLSRIKIEDLSDTPYFPCHGGFEIRIQRKYFTDRFWADEIAIKREGTNIWMGSIFVDCFYKALKVGGDPSVYEYDCSRLSTYPPYVREMKKYQKALFPLTEKVEDAIIGYVSSL